MLRKFISALFAVSLLVLHGVAAFAADGPPPDRAKLIFRDWQNESSLWGSNGGDVRLTASSITFEGRVSYGLRYVGETTTEQPYSGWRTRNFSVFAVSPPPPGTDDDNLICYDPNASGPQPAARYVAVGPEHWDDLDQLVILVFEGNRPPEDVGGPKERLCGEMTYILRPPQPPAERAKAMFYRDWNAYSRQTIATTGNIYLTPTSIDFARQAVLHLRYLSEVSTPNAGSNWGTKDFSLFEITDPRRLPLLRRNHLCGGHARNRDIPIPRYLAVGLSHPKPDEDDLLLLVFSTDVPPADVGQESCDGYSYFIDLTGAVKDGAEKYGRELKGLFEKR